jgi:tetratricopeptide (TPR) repeat protein
MCLTKVSLNTCIALLAAGLAPARAQSFITATPRASQRAVTSQRIALTDITITYHRPLVNGRKVWGGIVPFGNVWRAAYWLQEKVNLDEALKWSDRSIQIEERFDNLMTKGGVLEALNRATDAAAARTRAMEIGNATQVYFYGRQLQTQKQKAQAISVYRTVAKRFPQHWLGHMAQARAFVADGDFAGAIKEVRAAAAAGAPDAQKPNMETLIKRLESKEDING